LKSQIKITSIDLKTERQWRSVTGLNKERFYKLLSGFKEAFFSEEDTLIIEATEQRTVRPTDPKDPYSGKKAHTLKSMMIATPAKKIKYISACYHGKCHNSRLLKIEFPPDKPWFEKFFVRVDLGYTLIFMMRCWRSAQDYGTFI
jgi:hypothetical protein